MALRRQQPSLKSIWKPRFTAVLCSEHFLPSDFYFQWGRKLVKTDCVPSFFSFTSSVKHRKIPAKRYHASVTSMTPQVLSMEVDEPKQSASRTQMQDIVTDPKPQSSDHPYTKLICQVNMLVQKNSFICALLHSRLRK